MVHWMVYPLLHPLVQEARLVFYKHRFASVTTRCKLSFEVLYDRFSQEHADFKAIAIEAGISDSSLDSLYDNNFAQLFNRLWASDRRAMWHAHERELFLAKMRASLPDLACFKLIHEQATAAGHKVQAVLCTNKQGGVDGVLKRKVDVSTVTCMIHTVRPKPRFRNRTQRFARSQLTREMLEESPVHLYPVIIRGLHRTVSVIPASALRERFFPNPFGNKHEAEVYIGLRPDRLRRNSGAFPFWDYAGRWDLIPQAA